MKLLSLFLGFLFVVQQGHALSNYADVYPPVMQTLEYTTVFAGDRHGEFQGDLVALLSDGSGWKVHPDSLETYQTWKQGDIVRVALRNDFYWFKREHKFALYNHTRGGFIKIMLAFSQYPGLQIVSTDTYYNSTKPTYVPVKAYEVDADGRLKEKTEYQFTGYQPSDPRKVLALSDGSIWVIKDNLNEFQLGMNVYVGAQGIPGKFYDFVLIVGNEREAVWTMARPQK